jgi:hypothetical protein
MSKSSAEDADCAVASSAAATQLPLTSTSPCDQPFRFLDLPVELRCQVYEYFVVVGKIFYSPDEYSVRNEKRFKDWEAYRAPELTILRVCKQLHSEAEKIYLSKNLFVLPDFLSHREPFRQYPRQEDCVSLPDRPLFSKSAAKILKNISVSFNPRVPTPD